jgi:hypothetical protein
MNRNEIPFVYLGRRRFKGVRFPVKIFRVNPRHEYRTLRRRKIMNLLKNIAWLAAVLIVLYLLIKIGLRIF